MAVFHVLVLEEEPRVAHALARELRHLGARVTIVDAAEAVEAALRREATQLLVADLWTSSRKGLDVLAMAKAAFPQVRRCLLTGSIHELSAEQLQRISPCVFLSKPWDAKDVAKLVLP